MLEWILYGAAALVGAGVLQAAYYRAKYEILISNIEKHSDFVVLPIIHNKREYINEKTLLKTMKVIDRARDDDKPIMAILHTPGGYVFHSQRIAELLAEYEKVVGVIPHYAMSGGTYITLPIKKLNATESSVIGPIDPQLYIPKAGTWLPARDVKNVCRDQINDVIMKIHGEACSRLMEDVYHHAFELAKKSLPEKRAKEFVYEVLQKHNHSYGLKIKDVLPEKYVEIDKELLKVCNALIYYKEKGSVL